MTPDEFRAHLARLEISQQGFARLAGLSPQAVRKWIRSRDPLPIPRLVAILLPLLTPTKIRRLVAELDRRQDSQRGPPMR